MTNPTPETPTAEITDPLEEARQVPPVAVPAKAPGGLRQQAQLIAKNVASNWVGLVINTTLSFVLSPIVVNTLGSTYFGIWTLLQQFTGYLWLFDLGVRESVVKYVAQYDASGEHEALNQTVGTAVSMYAMVSGAGLLAAWGVAAALPYVFNIPAEVVDVARATAFLTGATVALSFLFNVYVGVLMGLQRMYLVSRLNIVFSVSRAIAIIILLKLGYGIISLAFVSFALSAINGWRVYRACRIHAPHLSLRPIPLRRDMVSRLLNYGKWVLVSNVGDKIIFSTDAIVVGYFMPVNMLAYYAIGGSLIHQLRQVVSAAANVVNPLSSGLQARNEMDALAQMIRLGTTFAVLLGLPICVGFLLLGERFIALWMGPQFAATSSQVLTALTIGSIVGLPYLTISGFFYGIGEHRLVALSRVVEGAANLLLSITLIKPYGLVGVALGTAIPHAIMVGIVLPALLPTRLPIRLGDYYVRTYVRPFLAAVPFVAACWTIAHVIVPTHLPLFLACGAAAMITYVVPAWFIGLSGEERTKLRHVLRRRKRA